MSVQDGVVYQIYPRSFQDSDGDGVGDLVGIRSRLDHLAWLGVDALWLSPIYPSPMADLGYDVSDYTDIDPVFGTLDDFDALVAAAEVRGLRVLMDIVPCHTSIQHPWFREHPDWYIWSDAPNNWTSAFGGSAWSALDGRYYLHSFYPEQPDLDWRNPEVVAAMQDVVRFWLDRGAAGYRVDAIDRLLKDRDLRDDPPATEPFGLPLRHDEGKLALVHSRNAPDTGAGLAKIREAAGDAFLVGEVYLPSAKWQPYLDHFDAVFAFELLHARWAAEPLRRAIAATTRQPGTAWVMSNHDFGRLATRFGPENARAAAMLLLTLPGTAFLYQGDEIGQRDGPTGGMPHPAQPAEPAASGMPHPAQPAEPAASGMPDPAQPAEPAASGFDRAGRDRFRHPMQWDASPSGGFTRGDPWLPLIDPAEHNVAAQRDDPGSMLALVRALIALRRELGDGFELLEAADGVVAYRRGAHVVAVNTTTEPLPVPLRGEPLLQTVHGALRDGTLLAHAGAIGKD